jgi:microcompartment protein CcmK/EutM
LPFCRHIAVQPNTDGRSCAVYIAKVIGNVVSTDKYDEYANKKLLLVQKLDLERKPAGLATIAIDYVGAGEGDTVMVGAAPGLASVVFNVPKAPIRELVMGIIDRVQVDGKADHGNSVRG